jgi:hypothetical protein
MATNYNPAVVSSGLIYCVDAGNTKSYSGSGTAWNDLIGGTNNGILTNSPTYSSTNGGYFTFDGSTQFVDSNTNVGLVPSAGITILSWFKTSINNRFLLDRMNSGLTQGYAIAGTSTNKIQIFINAIQATSASNANTNAWVHFAGVWSPSNYIRVYLNSALDAENTTSIPASITDPSVNLWLAKRRNGADMWSGIIANVQMYNRPLSTSEIVQNYTATKGRYGY